MNQSDCMVSLFLWYCYFYGNCKSLGIDLHYMGIMYV